MVVSDGCQPRIVSGETLIRLVRSSSSPQVIAPAALDRPYWDGALARMQGPLRWHTAARLRDGRVLVTDDESPAAEIYDVGNDTWSPTAPMSQARPRSTATQLSDGRVLVVGGWSGRRNLASGEIYDPSTDDWHTISPMANGRTHHTATLLGDGTVLVAGGSTGHVEATWVLAAAERYDPNTDAWSSAGSMSSPRLEHAATRLVDGRVFVTGGSNGGLLSTTEVYDQTTGSWSPLASLIVPRKKHTATLTRQGVLVVGGRNTRGGSRIESIAELYDFDTNTWSAAGSLGSFNDLTATKLQDGSVLFAGDSVRLPETYDRDGTRILSLAGLSRMYDPVSLSWSMTSTMVERPGRHTATLLDDGRVLVVGGGRGRKPATAEIYDPITQTWYPTGAAILDKEGHSETKLADGRILIAGGRRRTGDQLDVLNSVVLHHTSTGASLNTGEMAQPRWGHAAALLFDGRVLVAGGWDTANRPLASAEIYDPATGGWSSTRSMAEARGTPIVSLLVDGSLLVRSGIGETGLLHSSEVYDPSAGSWGPAPTEPPN